MVILGIDPGATGALAFYDPACGLLTILDMPTVEIKRGKRMVKHVDAGLVADTVSIMLDKPTVAFIEKVGAMPGQGVSSMFAFGRAVGVVEGALAGLNVPMTFVPPTVWVRQLGVVGGKDGSRKRAIELFPKYAKLFARVKDDGRADAALIARYGAAHLTTNQEQQK